MAFKSLKESEAKFLVYQESFKEVMGIEDQKDRYIMLLELFSQYREDQEIIMLADIYSMGTVKNVQLDRIEELRDLESDMHSEISRYEMQGLTFLNEIEKLRYILHNVDDSIRESILARIENEAFSKTLGPDSDDLDRMFTI